jgi:hypothetical protein
LEAKRLEEAEEPELDPKERTMTVLKLTARLGVTEAGIKVFENNDSKEQRPELDKQF